MVLQVVHLKAVAMEVSAFASLEDSLDLTPRIVPGAHCTLGRVQFLNILKLFKK